MIGGDNGSSGNVLKSKGDGTMEWGAAITPPTFSSVDYPGDDTALDPAGGQSLIINGTNFVSGITCTIDGTIPSSVTLNSATQITVTTPAKSAGTYTLVISNADGGSATTTNAVSYNGVPTFTHAAGSRGSFEEGATVNTSVVATEPDGGAITHTIISGSLPSGLSLNATTGAITGTAPDVSADTTSNFTIRATDNENQSTDRAYSITVSNVQPSLHFKPVIYSGNSSTQNVTVGFKPDLVWIKERGPNAENHNIYDSSRGAYKFLNSSSNAAEVSGGGGRLSAFTSTGFTVGSDNEINDNGSTYVAWCWKANGGTTSSNTDGDITSTVQANNALGFSIAKWTTSSSSSHTIGHGLNGKPDAVLYKKLSGTGSWFLYTDVIDGNWDELTLNATDAKVDYAATYATSTTFRTVSSSAGADWITYSFKSVSGFSKIGKYTGNGSANGPMVVTGFKPAFIMIKNMTSAYEWVIYDNKRSPSNPRNKVLYPNTTGAENSGENGDIDFLSNGFQLLSTTGSINQNGGTLMYMAFADDPDSTTPTLADSFNTVAYVGNGSATARNITTGFKPDLTWIKGRDTSGKWQVWYDSIRGVTNMLASNSTGAATTYGSVTPFSTGFTLETTGGDLNTNGENYISWNWKAGGTASINTDGNSNSIVSVNQNAGFSIVRYVGNQTAGHTIGHGLGAVPEVIILKCLDSTNPWYVYHVGVDSSYPAHYNLRLSATDARQDSTTEFNDTAPTSSVFTLGTAAGPNKTANKYIAYCFTSKTGFSKFGSYSGSGSNSNAVSLGFQPNWVMVKRSNSTGGWLIFDSVRSGSNPINDRIEANNTQGEQTNSGDKWLNFNSTNFEANGSDTELNASGSTYVYMAFKIN